MLEDAPLEGMETWKFATETRERPSDLGSEAPIGVHMEVVTSSESICGQKQLTRSTRERTGEGSQQRWWVVCGGGFGRESREETTEETAHRE